jgi:hypothetical protein
MQGLLGICSSKPLWATNIHYLNDFLEFSQGLTIADQRIRHFLSRSNPPTAKALLEHCLDRLRSLIGSPIFVASFSQDGDRLSQWRGYSEPSGVAIAFDFKEIVEIAGHHGAFIIKCLYKDDEKVQTIDWIIEQSVRKLDSIPAGQDPIIFCSSAFAGALLTYAPAFKHRAFSEEAEWRLVTRVYPFDSRISSRATARMVIPHFDVDLAQPPRCAIDRHETIGISGVVVGPHSHTQLAMEGVRSMMQSKKMRCEWIAHSDAPYRTI